MNVDGGSGLAAREPAHQTVAAYLATIAHFAGPIALVYYPGRVGPGAILVALVAAAMGGFEKRFITGSAVIATTVWWFIGMVIAVLLERPLF